MNRPVNYRYVISSLVVLGVLVFAFFSLQNNSTSPLPDAVEWHTFNDGLSLARNSNKKILVDVYTHWCSWCKKMDSEVYTNKGVTRILREHFILVKLDAESNSPLTYQGKNLTEAEFAQNFGVTGYPTTLFFDPDANAITTLPGYAPPERFATILDFIGENYYKSVSFQEYVKSHTSLP
jgi:thioredoxin-related protein